MAMALTFALSGVISTPTVASAATKKTVTVKTQKQLDAALKDKQVTSIVIKTSKNVTLKIEDGDYSKKTLTVTSPKATINNYGDFKKISVNDGKYLIDRGESNSIVVKDTNSLKLTTGKQSSDTKITVSGKGGKISIVNNGSVDAIKVNGKSTVTVGGNSKESPTITNNATGAKIVAAQDASVVLNKQATLTVKAGTSLDSLTVKADAKISVAKGATVETVVVSGKASDVSLTVNGTVSNVTVGAKADVAVTGSTTGTVAITNNAEGATIQSEVKTDVTLNADAKVSLNKGAEGSSVTAGNSDIKPDVTNNTSEKVTVTDSTGKDTTVEAGKDSSSTDTKDPAKDTENKDNNTSGGGSAGGGSTGGGDYSGGGSTTPIVTITPTITITEDGSSATVLKTGVVLNASATNSANASVDYTYEWFVGNTKRGEGAVYTIQTGDSGCKLTVKASATINGKQVSGTATSGTVKRVASQDETFAAANVPCNITADNVANYLKGYMRLKDESGYTAGGKITWDTSKYEGVAGQTYQITGTIDLPGSDWIWASESAKTVTVNVTVLAEGALSFSYSKYTPASIADENVAYNQAHYDMSAGTNSYTCYVAANTLKLKNYTIDGEHQWIGVNVTVKNLPASNEATVDLEYSKDGATWTDVGTGIVTTTDAADTVTVWLPFDTCKDSSTVVYLRNNAGDSSISTPVTFSFTEEYLKLTAVTPVEIDPIDAGTYGGTIKNITEMGLPATLTFTDEESESHTINITWDIDECYKNAAGTYDAWVVLDENAPIYLADNVKLPEVKVTVKPVKLTEVTGTANNIQAGVEGNVTGIMDLSLLDTITCKGEDGQTYSLDLDWHYPDEYDTNPIAGLYDFTACVLDSENNWNYDTTAIASLLPAIKVIVKAAAPTVLANTDKTISVDAKPGYEYACATADSTSDLKWVLLGADSVWNGTFTGLDPAKDYYLFARAAGDDNNLTVSASTEVTTEDAVAAASLVTLTLNETLNADSKYVTDGTLVLKDDATSDYVLGAAGNAVRARMNCVENVSGFSGAAATGYYLPLYFETDANVSNITVTGLSNTEVSLSGTGPGYRDLLVRIPGPAQIASLTIDLDGEGKEYLPTTYTVDVNSQAGIFPIQLKAADYVSFVYPEGSGLKKTEANLLSGKSGITQMENPENGSSTSIRLQGTPTKGAVEASPYIDVFIKISDDTSVQRIKASIGQNSTSTDKVTPDSDGNWSTDDWSGQYIKASDGTTYIKLTVSLTQGTYDHGAIWSILIDLYKSNPDGTTYEAKCLPISLDFTNIQPTS